MYFADGALETTTTTGTGNITLLGAVAQHFAISSDVLVGDQFGYSLLDGNGIGREDGIGTLVDATHVSRDIVQKSTNANALIVLSSGTHKIFVTYTATDANKRLVMGDAFIDYVVSGLLLPSSGSLTASASLGVAYVGGQRVVKGAQSLALTASKDNYVDLSSTGVLTIQPVTLAAAAPTLTANSIRLGFVKTGASTVTSATTTGKDSLGNWMRNTIRAPTCVLSIPYNASISAPAGATAIPFSSASHELTDNDTMHSISTNNTRVTCQHAGYYSVQVIVQFGNGAGGVSSGNQYYAEVHKNGTLIDGTQVGQRCNTGDYPAAFSGWAGNLAVGDYIEGAGYNGDPSSQTIVRGNMFVYRTG